MSWWRDGKRPRSGKERIAALDAKTLQLVRDYPAGTDPECVAVSPDGKQLYLSNEDAGTAPIVDVASGKTLATCIVGTEPEGVTASPDGKRVYVTAETSNVISVLDPKQRKTAANILVDARPRGVALLATGDNGKRDAIGVVDTDPESRGFGRLVGLTEFPQGDNELHHFGWNACSSHLCPWAANAHIDRRYLVVPGTHSSRIHILDTKPDPRQPKLVKVIEGEEVMRKTGYAAPHTVHCGPDGMRADVFGNLWCSSNAPLGYSGVLVFNPDGKLIGRIRLPEVCANVTFGGPKRNFLFTAASQSLYVLQVQTQGAAPG